MKHYDLSINGGPFLKRVEAVDFSSAAEKLAIDSSKFEETTPGVYEGGSFVIQEIDAEPFHVATEDLEELIAILESMDAKTGRSISEQSPAMARISSRAKDVVEQARKSRGQQ